MIKDNPISRPLVYPNTHHDKSDFLSMIITSHHDTVETMYEYSNLYVRAYEHYSS